VTERTPFVIGSISKAITAYAALALAEEGRLDLDGPATRHLPWPTFAVDAGVVVLLLWAVPRLWGVHLDTMFFIQPDLACLMCGVAALSGVMVILRLSLLLVVRASED